MCAYSARRPTLSNLKYAQDDPIYLNDSKWFDYWIILQRFVAHCSLPISLHFQLNKWIFRILNLVQRVPSRLQFTSTIDRIRIRFVSSGQARWLTCQIGNAEFFSLPPNIPPTLLSLRFIFKAQSKEKNSIGKKKKWKENTNHKNRKQGISYCDLASTKEPMDDMPRRWFHSCQRSRTRLFEECRASI